MNLEYDSVRMNKPSAVFDLRKNEIHVIDFRLDQPLRDADVVLDEPERQRAMKLMYDSDRRRFRAAHCFMRFVLGRYLSCSPKELRFTYGTQGKPRLIETDTDLRFNLSHSGGRAILAMARGREVGVDIELHRSIEVINLARRFFAAAEFAALLALKRSDQIAAFYRCWTRKEAFLKALGCGLASPLDAFEVDLSSIGDGQLLRSCRAWPEALVKWRIVSLSPAPGYSAALAAEAGDWRVSMLEMSPGGSLAFAGVHEWCDQWTTGAS